MSFYNDVQKMRENGRPIVTSAPQPKPEATAEAETPEKAAPKTKTSKVVAKDDSRAGKKS